MLLLNPLQHFPGVGRGSRTTSVEESRSIVELSQLYTVSRG
jgi:hypothetical protein